jgi:hypothetical protein
MGNSDAPIITPSMITDCSNISINGNVYSLGGGNYYGTIHCNHPDGRILMRVIYFNEDFSVITYGPIIFDAPAGTLQIYPSIVQIGSEFHLSYFNRAGAAVTAELTFAKASALDGTYVVYQSSIRGDTANDGTPWSNNADICTLFEYNGDYYCIFGGTGKWAQGGTKGNREYCVAKYDVGTSLWVVDVGSPCIINPLYWSNISNIYSWAEDHVGGPVTIFFDSDRSILFMGAAFNDSANTYQPVLLVLNTSSSATTVTPTTTAVPTTTIPPLMRGVTISHKLPDRVTSTDLVPYVVFSINPGLGNCYEFLDMFINSTYKPSSVVLSLNKDLSDPSTVLGSKITTYNPGWFYIHGFPKTIGKKVLIGKTLYVKVLFDNKDLFYDLRQVKTGFRAILGG